MVEAFHIPSQAEQAALRRQQFISVVAHLVVTRGVGAVSHTSVAEVAGCARSLVYRYFPRREDLLYSLLAAFDEGLVERFTTPAEVVDGVLALRDARSGHVPPATRTLFEKLWDASAWTESELEFRLACVILMRDSSLSSELGVHRADLDASMQRRLLGPLEAIGLTPVETWIVVDAMLSVMHRVTKAVWEGEMGTDEAFTLLVSVSARVLQTFSDESTDR